MPYRTFLGWCLVGLLALAVAPLVPAAQTPKYPRVNVAIGYEFDPKWPQRPKEAGWGHVPGIAVDAKDNVYVFTRDLPPVQVYDASGKYLRGWGEKTIKNAHHIRIDSKGDVWIADIGHHVVEKYTPTGELLLTLGTKGKEGRDKDHFNMPTDMAVLPSGDVYVSDGYGNARVVHFDKNGKFVREWGELGHKPGMFSIPHSIAADSKGRLYVADRNNARIQVFDGTGKFLTEWRDLIIPWGLWVTKNDEVWACGSTTMRWRKDDTNLGIPPNDQIVMRFNTEGKLLQLIAIPKGADGLERPGEVNWVHCLAVDSQGHLYLGDIKGKKAQKFLRQAPDK